MAKAPASKAAPAARKTTAIRDPYTKTQLLNTLAENTGLARKEVASVLDELSVLIERHVKKRGAGTFTFPGLMKIKTVRKPASKARKMISPFTKEEITVAAKPAKTVVKVQPLRGLKVMVE